MGVLRFEDSSLVIKPLQSFRESEIARIAGELGFGPAQHSSLPGYLTEEKVEGGLFPEVPPDRRGSDVMKAVGRSLGRLLRRLHDAGIYYYDASISNPEGRSHLIVDETGGCTLIDFGSKKSTTLFARFRCTGYLSAWLAVAANWTAS